MTARKKSKPPRPADARRALRRLWSTVAVYSCADGTVKIEAVWKGVRPYTPADGGGPGMFSRLHAAELVARVLDLPVKRINWNARAKRQGLL